MKKTWISIAGMAGLVLFAAGCTTIQQSQQQAPAQPVEVVEEAVVSTGYQPIQSDNIYSAKYDEATQVLTIVFFEDGVYDYEAVPKQAYDAFIQADDKDGYFEEEIKDMYTGTKFSMD